MTSKPLARIGLALAALTFAAASTSALAAGECVAQYGYFTGVGPTRQDNTTTVTLNAGQTTNLNRNNMNFVKSTGNNKLDVTLTGAFNNNFTLNKDQRNPSNGPYLTPVNLVRLFCTSGATAVAFGSPEQLVNALKQSNTNVNQIAQQLVSTFNQTGQQVATLLQAAGYTANQVTAALVSAFNATGAQAATWLKAATFTGEQVAAALKAQFNASATQVASWVRTAFNATGAQVATWLRAAAFTGEQVAAALKAQFNATASQAAAWLSAAFNASAQQLATWLRSAGYTLVQVAQALEDLDLDAAQAMAAVRQAFGVSWSNIVEAYRNIIVALQPGNCGAAGCNQGAQLLRAAGASAAEALGALRVVVGLSESAARQIASDVFLLANKALEMAITAAGYAATTLNRTVAQNMELLEAIHGTRRDCSYPTGPLYGPRLAPLPMPNDGNAHTITIRGNTALVAASGISGGPSGTSFSIRERGSCFLIVEFRVPTRAPVGSSGQAAIMAGGTAGASLPWTVGPIPSNMTTQTIYVAPGRSTSPLQVTVDQATLYKVGSGTMTDADSNVYTKLENNAPHCQTVPQPNPPFAANNAWNSSRRNINVGPIAWQVRNSGNTAANAVTVELVQGAQVLASQTVTLQPGQTLPLTPYTRVQNQTCVARLGNDSQCFHCGQISEGWNDNGVSARVRQ